MKIKLTKQLLINHQQVTESIFKMKDVSGEPIEIELEESICEPTSSVQEDKMSVCQMDEPPSSTPSHKRTEHIEELDTSSIELSIISPRQAMAQMSRQKQRHKRQPAMI